MSQRGHESGFEHLSRKLLVAATIAVCTFGWSEAKSQHIRGLDKLNIRPIALSDTISVPKTPLLVKVAKPETVKVAPERKPAIEKGPNPFELCLDMAQKNGFYKTSLESVRLFIESIQSSTKIDSLTIINYYFPRLLQYGVDNNLDSLEKVLDLWQTSWRHWYLWEAMTRDHKQAGGQVNDLDSVRKSFDKLCRQAGLPRLPEEKFPPTKEDLRDLPVLQNPGYRTVITKTAPTP